MSDENQDGGEHDLDLADLENESESPASGPDAFDNLPNLPDEVPTNAKELEAVYEIPVQVSAVLGKASMQVSQLLKLGRGAVGELVRKVGESIDICVNNRLVAWGEVGGVEDRLGVTMTESSKTERS